MPQDDPLPEPPDSPAGHGEWMRQVLRRLAAERGEPPAPPATPRTTRLLADYDEALDAYVALRRAASLSLLGRGDERDARALEHFPR